MIHLVANELLLVGMFRRLGFDVVNISGHLDLRLGFGQG